VLTYGARATRGSDRRNLFLEFAGTNRLKNAPGISKSNTQWSSGVEFQAGEGVWLSTGFGKRYTSAGEPDRVVLLAGMRWGVSSKARLRMLPKYAPGA
jgi:hypothetical protein